MMYGNKLAAAIKVNGKVLREFKDTVYIPFGSEYSILVKNLHTTRAVVNIFLDGENVVPGGLVIDPGREVDLERWIKNGNLSEGNRFKFIERTQAIEDGPRGIKLEDGLIRIEHQFEQLRPIINIADTFWNNNKTWSTPYYSTNATSTGVSGGLGDRFSVSASGATYSTNVGGVMRGIDTSKNGEATAQAASAAVDQYCADNGIKNSIGELHDGMATMDWMTLHSETGITVPGSKSTQSFKTVTMGLMESATYSMVIKLLGDLGNNKPVTKPVTVAHKPKCTTCGKQNKATAKFCTECGTALEIFA
jgi:hypothetical protein